MRWLPDTLFVIGGGVAVWGVYAMWPPLGILAGGVYIMAAAILIGVTNGIKRKGK